MNSKVIVMQGCSGSGKSTLAKTLSAEHDAFVISADDFFLNDKEEYIFNRELLGNAHGYCFYKYLEYLAYGANIIVDNTNTTAVEIAPYAAAVSAINYKNPGSYSFEIISVERDIYDCIKYNSHGVDSKTIKNQANNIEWFNKAGNKFRWKVSKHFNDLRGDTNVK